MLGFARISCLGAAFACASGLAVVASAPAFAQGSYSPYNETPAAALARYVRALADDPKDFNSLIGAGRAALELGDAQAAGGFFARADDVDPRSPLPQEGMGAVQVANGDAKAALPYFRRAEQLGAVPAQLGCDRGLAYDLMGQQAKAQSDYRAALSGADADETRRRLALSLAISGDKADAIATIAPLAAKGDSSVSRVRAFVLALTGDSGAAMTAIDAAMPGSWSRVAPFLQRLPSLSAGEKAAAVNLGIFPDSNQPAYAYASVPSAAPTRATASDSGSSDRLSGIDALLQQPSSAPQAQPVWEQPPMNSQPQPVRIAYSPQPRPSVVQRTAVVDDSKVWLQLASGRNATALQNEFGRLKRDNSDLFKGITGYVAQSSDRARLVIGPFRGASDAKIFADDLRSIGVDAFRWTNSDSDRIVPVAEE
jgi:Flp pilus assembly protein TadD